MKDVIIQKQLLKDLKKCIATFNQKSSSRLKLDFAVYIIGLVLRLPTLNRGHNSYELYARLCSKKLRKIHYKYQDCLKFLINENFIEKKKNYGSDVKTCNAYQITERYYKDEVVRYSITDKFLLKKIISPEKDNMTEEKMSYVENERPHLICSFDNHLSMDIGVAYEAIKGCLKTNPAKYISSSQLILEWHHKAWHYSINPETDNRLHTILTRTNRDLRSYISYKEEQLVAVDIKTSQPYFLCSFLKGIVTKDREHLNRIGVPGILSESQITDFFNLDLDVNNLRHFAKMVLKGDFYSNLVPLLPISYDYERPFRMVWPNGKFGQPKVKKRYSTERDLTKEVLLEFFNGSQKSKKPEIVALRREFPAISQLIKHLNSCDIEAYRLLSFIEAYCLLDVVALKLFKGTPKMPLFSIHDSLVTSRKYASALFEGIESLLEDRTGLKPKLEMENWGDKHTREIHKKESA